MIKNESDIVSFEKIVKDQHPKIFRIIMGFIHTKEDAEDLTQDVFIKAYQNWNFFRGDSEVSTWLYRIAINTSLNYITQKKRRGLIQLGEDMFKNVFNKPNNDKDPHQKMEENELNDIIKKAIDSLVDKQRTAFILSRYEDLPQKEIAKIMQISEGSVEQLLFRAKTNLKKRLDIAIGKTNL